LLITGLADVWAALRQQADRRDERFGLALMVLSAASFALMAAMVKLLLPDTPTQAVVLSRGVMLTAVFSLMARRQGVPLMGQRPGMLLLRGLLGYGALSCYFFSVHHLPLGDAVLLQYSHPLFVASMAPFLLGERTGTAHWPLVLAALCGVALIVGPSGDLRGAALVGLFGSSLSGLAYIAVRKLARSEHPLTILVWFPLATIPFSLVATLRVGAEALPRDGREVAGHLLVTASALVGQIALTHGLVRVRAAPATAVTMTGPVFGVLYGALFFGNWPTAASLAGMSITITALVLLARARASGSRRGDPVPLASVPTVPRDRSSG
jgi:drug/metabolite transporter (DMT)-like permease